MKSDWVKGWWINLLDFFKSINELGGIIEPRTIPAIRKNDKTGMRFHYGDEE